MRPAIGDTLRDIEVTTTGDGSFTVINAGTGNDAIAIASTGAGSVTIVDGEGLLVDPTAEELSRDRARRRDELAAREVLRGERLQDGERG